MGPRRPELGDGVAAVDVEPPRLRFARHTVLSSTSVVAISAPSTVRTVLGALNPLGVPRSMSAGAMTPTTFPLVPIRVLEPFAHGGHAGHSGGRSSTATLESLLQPRHAQLRCRLQRRYACGGRRRSHEPARTARGGIPRGTGYASRSSFSER